MQQPVQQQQSGSSVGGKLSDEDMFTVAMLMKNNKMDRQQAIQAVMNKVRFFFVFFPNFVGRERDAT